MTDGGAARTGHGRLVRPYVVTGGRTRPRGEDLALEALVTTTSLGADRAAFQAFERGRILQTCHTPMSVAEVAAALEVPSGVARVLVGDLVEAGMLRVAQPTATNEQLIRRLIDGIRSL